MEALTKNSTTPDVEDWDVSFGIPMNELKEILNAAELARNLQMMILNGMKPNHASKGCLLQVNKQPLF
ncbi:hypothetical protein TNCT_233421 [Trichonephila clavata]|uniref:Uncharacterized protein n=1 Tax=Trichonephila clavata TaxID=2740835 RepID=A0A8X6JR61_TRICU|nr:hypothetical protein TNCT_233421 [Trichonephila clavata]